MFKLVSTALIAGLVAVPAFAAATRTPLDFERDGVRYVGTVVEEADGTRHITGREVSSGRTFALDAVNGQVTGHYDGAVVAYRVPAPRAARTIVTASNDGSR